MGILDDALNSQDAKRSQRLSKEAQKSKIENNKIKEGTYRGIDLVDGTAKIQLDGQTNTTSGYKLITNAPLGDGDRVSIRPNGVGMPRVDAKNVALKIAEESAIEDILREATVSSIDIFVYTGSIFVSCQKSNFRAVYPNQLIYKYVNSKLTESPTVNNANIVAYGENVRRDSNENPIITPIIVTASLESTNQDLVFTVNLNTPFESVTVSGDCGQNLQPSAILFVYTISFPIKQWIDLLKKFQDYKDWINPAIEKFYLWADCPIEIDARGGADLSSATNFGLIESLILITSDATAIKEASTIFLTVDAFRNPRTPDITPFPTGTAFQFAARFRKRTSGDPLPWFSLG